MMKPDKNLDRSELLDIVHRALQGSSTAPAGTLVAIVRKIMDELNDSKTTNDCVSVDSVSSNKAPIAVYDVAAFVDGTITDPDLVARITESAKSDPGLLMEIVSAIRTELQPTHDAPSDELRKRLIGLHQGRQPIDEEQTAATIPTAPQIKITETQRFETSSQPPISTPLTLAILAVATAILIVGGWWIQSTPFDDNDSIATGVGSTETGPSQDPNTKQDGFNPPKNNPRENILLADDAPKTSSTPDKNVANVSPRSPGPLDAPTPLEAATREQPATADQRRPGGMGIGTSDDSPMVAADSLNTPNQDPDDPVITPRTKDTNAPNVSDHLPSTESHQLVATWKQIDGLLLESQQTTSGTQSESARPSAVAVAEGQTTDFSPVSSGRRVQLQTLPLCRATADLAEGGQFVMAADTQINLGSTGVIDLQHGSVAFLNLAPSTTVRVGRNPANALTFHADNGSIVIHRTVTGLQIDVSGEPATINGRTYSESRLEALDGSRVTRRSEDAPERLPRWTNERVDRIEIGRNVLAQLATSSDTSATMMQTLQSGVVRGKAANTLRTWIIAANRNRLLRLIASPDPLIREAALMHLQTVDPKDPRHRLLWRSIQNQGNNTRTFASVRSYFVDLWAKRRPTGARREQLLRLLQAPDPAVRATANYLLRAFYGPGPRFDLTAQPAARTRMAAAWRVIIQRTDSR